MHYLLESYTRSSPPVAIHYDYFQFWFLHRPHAICSVQVTSEHDDCICM